MYDERLIDRQKGCMYGLVIGDALGAAVEFRPPGSFAPVIGYRGLGPHGLDPGEWTDDTSMALALADSIGQKGWDLKDQLERYNEWYQNGKYSVNNWCFDIGGTTKKGIEDFVETGQVVADHDEWSAGNGSIMRLAPVAIRYCLYAHGPVRAAQSSQTTHSHKLCVSACDLLYKFLCSLMMSALNESPRSRWNLLDDILEYGNVSSEMYKVGREYETDIKGSGFVIESLKAALWAFMTADNFEEAVLKAVNLGDDSDTTGAIAGQMAGAYWGYNAIPQTLIEGLAKKEMIDQYLNPLLNPTEPPQ